MTSRPFRHLIALLVTAISAFAGLSAGTAAPALAADCADNPVTAVRGAEPLCDNPNGRTFTLDFTEAAPGQKVTVKGTGFVRDAGGGQTLAIKLNDVDIVTTLEADENGDVSGEVELPSLEVFKGYAEQYNAKRWWLRVLVGMAVPDDMPAASLHAEFKLNADLSGGESTDTETTGTETDDEESDGDEADGDGAGTTTTPGGTNTTTGSASTLPKAGLEDHPGLLIGGLLAILAAALFWGERRFSRRAGVASTD